MSRANIALALPPGAVRPGQGLSEKQFTEGIPFLGFRLFPDHRRLRSNRGHAAWRRLQALARQCAAGEVDVERLTAAVQGWVAHAVHGDTWGLRRSLPGSIVI